LISGTNIQHIFISNGFFINKITTIFPKHQTKQQNFYACQSVSYQADAPQEKRCEGCSMDSLLASQEISAMIIVAATGSDRGVFEIRNRICREKSQRYYLKYYLCGLNI